MRKLIMATNSTTLRRQPDMFLVAFSFAGEHRDIIRPIAESVEQRLGFGTVFFDEWFEADLAGSSSDLKLQKIYAEQCEVVVFCPSAEYGNKKWTVTEWDAIRERRSRLRADRNPRAADRVLPLRVGDGEIEGDFGHTIWIEARQRTANYVADLIIHRLTDFVPYADRPLVFLAETTPDLEDDNMPVNRQRLKTFLEDTCKCIVLPSEPLIDHSMDDYHPALETEMGRSMAFIQLLSPYPWKPFKFDQIQHSTAEKAGCPMYRFRGDIDLDRVSKAHAEHRQFLEANDSITGGFEDFKQHLAEKLKSTKSKMIEHVRKLQQEELRARTGADSGEDDSDRPLVRVAIRARNENDIWDPVFKILFEKENILLDELAPGESFATRHRTEPCNGFLILCDEYAQTDEDFSPRQALMQCRLIQTQFKNSACVPPVGLVYWPPPAPAWSQLLKSIPRALHRILGNSLEDGLEDFLIEVRKQARKAAL